MKMTWFDIQSLGFRGEALPSNRFVAELSIKTDKQGGRHRLGVNNRWWTEISCKPDGIEYRYPELKCGTCFFTTPARLKISKE